MRRNSVPDLVVTRSEHELRVDVVARFFKEGNYATELTA